MEKRALTRGELGLNGAIMTAVVTIPNPFNPGHTTTVTVHFEPWNAHVWSAYVR